MRRLFNVLGVLCLINLGISSCNKKGDSTQQIRDEIKDTLTAQQKLSMQIFGNAEFKFNKNDSSYLNALRRLSRDFNLSQKGNSVNSCNLNGGDSTFSWFSDPDGTIIEGPYCSGKNSAFETTAANCTNIQLSADEANQYLINEGYPDIAAMYYTWPARRYRVIHAANALIELKSEFIKDYYKHSGQQVQSKLFNCILQALGYTVLGELGASWATMSRQQIIKAVGKLASKYLNWFGAAIAIISFIDCMWG